MVYPVSAFRSQNVRLAVLALTAALIGCQSGIGLLNPEFVELLRPGSSAKGIPGDDPAILVYVQNLTDRWAVMTISYRTSADAVVQYTTSLNPGDKSGQVIVCPVTEITLGNVSDLSEVGVRVGARRGPLSSEDPLQEPFIEVEPFGILLVEDVNYSCGDALTFVVQPSDSSSSGFGTIAYRQVGEATDPNSSQ
jgi:hypothetical protein